MYYTQQSNLKATKCKFPYIQTLAGCMSKTTEDIKISLNVSLKGSPKGVFPTKIFEIKIFILKCAKNTTFLPKN